MTAPLKVELDTLPLQYRLYLDSYSHDLKPDGIELGEPRGCKRGRCKHRAIVQRANTCMTESVFINAPTKPG